MKKNIFTIIVIAICVVNMVLTSVMLFVMLPAFSSMNKIITQVAAILNIELEEENGGEPEYSIADLEVKAVTFDAKGNKQTINLVPGTDGEKHYGVIDGVRFNLNTKAEDYSDIVDVIDNKPSILTDVIKEVISSYSYDNISAALVKEQALIKLSEKLGGTKCIVDITLDGFMYS